MSEFEFRAGSMDEGIHELVVERNEHRLPDRFDADDLVVDIGAHIGCFAVAPLERGSRRVVAVEADPENYRRARRHLQPYVARGHVRLNQAAVWRSDAARSGRLPPPPGRRLESGKVSSR